MMKSSADENQHAYVGLKDEERAEAGQGAPPTARVHSSHMRRMALLVACAIALLIFTLGLVIGMAIAPEKRFELDSSYNHNPSDVLAGDADDHFASSWPPTTCELCTELVTELVFKKEEMKLRVKCSHPFNATADKTLAVMCELLQTDPKAAAKFSLERQGIRTHKIAKRVCIKKGACAAPPATPLDYDPAACLACKETMAGLMVWVAEKKLFGICKAPKPLYPTICKMYQTDPTAAAVQMLADNGIDVDKAAALVCVAKRACPPTPEVAAGGLGPDPALRPGPGPARRRLGAPTVVIGIDESPGAILPFALTVGS